ncbi:MAG TPA: hypothetical protein VMV49_07135 [Candidatus Deferrimicrobium sp.]|nr:hypothetical protein [Candidatus Deferrimicrobium sp.]
MTLTNPDLNFKLKMLLASRTREHLLNIIKEYNDYCITNDLKDRVLKGFSKKPYNTKEGLLDFLLERISDEEKQGIFNKIEDSYIQDLIKSAQEYLEKRAAREKIEIITMREDGIYIKFKGWQWETEIDIKLGPDKSLTSYHCSCSVGNMDGFCVHLMTGLLILLKEKKFNQTSFLFKIPESSLNTIQKLEIDTKEYEDLDEHSADIILGDDYFLSIKGNLVTMKWTGDYEGKKSVDISEEKNPISIEEWVAKKVVEKILAPLRDHPYPREINKDTFGVVSIILQDEKLVNKLLKKFLDVNESVNAELPTTKEDLESFLKAKL